MHDNSFLRDDGETPSLKPPRITLITEGFYNAFVKRFSLSCLQDYSAIREIASVSTLIFEESVSIPLGSALNQGSYPVFFLSVLSALEEQGEASSEIESIKNAASSEDSLRIALDFLKRHPETSTVTEISPFNFNPSVPSACPYKVVVTGRDIYIIVEEGILSHLEGKAFQLDFLRAVLKALYSLERIHNVNRGSWYCRYIEVLSSSVSL